MYKDIGKKIKALAKGTFLVEAIASLITGFVFLIDTGEPIYILIIIFGPVVAWISSWLLYGFGEIIDKLCDIERNTRGEQSDFKNKETIEKDNFKAEIISKREEKARAQQQKDDELKRAIENYALWKTTAFSKQKLDSDKYMEIECPICYEKLMVEKGAISAYCPFCEWKFKIDD